MDQRAAIHPSIHPSIHSDVARHSLGLLTLNLRIAFRFRPPPSSTSRRYGTGPSSVVTTEEGSCQTRKASFTLFSSLVSLGPVVRSYGLLWEGVPGLSELSNKTNQGAFVICLRRRTACHNWACSSSITSALRAYLCLPIPSFLFNSALYEA